MHVLIESILSRLCERERKCEKGRERGKEFSVCSTQNYIHILLKMSLKKILSKKNRDMAFSL